jgi:hypothetical protein
METIQPEATGRRSPARGRKLLPTTAVMARYSVSDRTVDRWEVDPTLGFPSLSGSSAAGTGTKTSLTRSTRLRRRDDLVRTPPGVGGVCVHGPGR